VFKLYDKLEISKDYQAKLTLFFTFSHHFSFSSEESIFRTFADSATFLYLLFAIFNNTEIFEFINAV